MAFFEELGKKITQTSQGVVQKTKDTAEVLRLNSIISDEEKGINALYNQIGKKYFELHGDSAEEAFVSLVEEIKNAKNRVNEYSEQVKKLKGVVSCPHCGADVQYGMMFCSTCGSRMEVPTVEAQVPVEPIPTEQTSAPSQMVVPAPAYRFCTTCGMKLEEGCAFCTNCGTKAE